MGSRVCHRNEKKLSIKNVEKLVKRHRNRSALLKKQASLTGDSVGEIVGKSVGLEVGLIVGTSDGERVGNSVGVGVGCVVWRKGNMLANFIEEWRTKSAICNRRSRIAQDVELDTYIKSGLLSRLQCG